MAVAVAQSAIQVAANTTSRTVVLPGATTNPSFLALSAAVYRGSATAITMDDGGAHTWTPVAAEQGTTSPDVNQRLRSWTAPNTSTTPATVTVTLTGGFSYFAVVLLEVTGHDTTTPLDGVTPVTAGPTGASPATLSITPGTANALIIAAMTVNNAGAGNTTITPNETQVQESEDWSGTNIIAVQQFLQSGGPTAKTMSWTITTGYTAGQWLAHAFVIRAAGGVAATSLPVQPSRSMGLRIR